MIAGKKVRLRPVEVRDLEFCQMLYNDPRIRQMVVGWDFPVSMAAQNKWFEASAGNTTNLRLLVESDEGEAIGITGLWDIDWHNRNAMTGVKLKYGGTEGKGYGRDTIMVMNAYAFFEVGLHRLWGLIIEYNIPSLKSYIEKSGWKVEGILRHHVFRNGTFHNVYYVACLKSDFLAVPDAVDYVPREIPDGMHRCRLEVFQEE